MQPAIYCAEHPVTSYLLTFRSGAPWMVIDTTLAFNATEVVLGPQNGLKENQKYVYTITAINSIGNVTTDPSVNRNVICESFIHKTSDSVSIFHLFSYE